MAGARKRSSLSDFHVCALYHRAVELIGRRWNGAIIEALMSGARRFCEIRAAVPGLKDPQLARRLRELEREGIVERRVVPTQPVRVEYALTRKGEDLRAVLAEVHRWAQRWLQETADGEPGADGGSAADDEPATVAARLGGGDPPERLGSSAGEAPRSGTDGPGGLPGQGRPTNGGPC